MAATSARSRNGHSSNPVGTPRAKRASSNGRPKAKAEPGGSLAGRLVKGIANRVVSRVPAADLDERDPDYIRESLPRLWLLCSLSFRGAVRGLATAPEEGGVLL